MIETSISSKEKVKLFPTLAQTENQVQIGIKSARKIITRGS